MGRVDPRQGSWFPRGAGAFEKPRRKRNAREVWDLIMEQGVEAEINLRLIPMTDEELDSSATLKSTPRSDCVVPFPLGSGDRVECGSR
jgi:hypothetical protein